VYLVRYATQCAFAARFVGTVALQQEPGGERTRFEFAWGGHREGMRDCTGVLGGVFQVERIWRQVA
jgi:hypothetical protein